MAKPKAAKQQTKKTDTSTSAVVTAPVKQQTSAGAAVPSAPAARIVTRAEFVVMVREEAYRRAANRNFQNGTPFQDWVSAESALEVQLTAQGVKLQPPLPA